MSDVRTHDRRIAAARLAASWLLSYPDDALLARLDQIAAVAAELPERMGGPIGLFLDHLSGTPLIEVQEHYVLVFDMKRKACPYLSYWTDGDTRNRGRAILRFKQAYLDAGYEMGSEELPDHLSVVLEFAAVGDPLTGDALLAEHQDTCSTPSSRRSRRSHQRCGPAWRRSRRPGHPWSPSGWSPTGSC